METSVPADLPILSSMLGLRAQVKTLGCTVRFKHQGGDEEVFLHADVSLLT